MYYYRACIPTYSLQPFPNVHVEAIIKVHSPMPYKPKPLPPGDHLYSFTILSFNKVISRVIAEGPYCIPSIADNKSLRFFRYSGR